MTSPSSRQPPGAFAAVAALWAARGMRADSLLTRGAGLVNAFVAPNSPYGAVGFVFNDSMAPVLTLWLLAFWCALVGWRAAGNLQTPRRAAPW